jgi:hypothetical protein
MSVKSTLERIHKVWGDEGVLLWALRVLVDALGKVTPNAMVKRFVRRHMSVPDPGHPAPDKPPKTPRWVSEFWVLFCLLLAIASVSFATPLLPISFSWSLIGLSCICVVWPIVRLIDLTQFVVDWVFVSKASLHSIRRSLLSFLFNLFEVALLLASLRVSLSVTSAQATNWVLAYEQLVSMITIAVPAQTVSFSQSLLEQFRFWFGLLVMLCIVGSLAGGVVRRSLDSTER